MDSTPKGKILVVDDSAAALSFTRLALQGAGYEVVTKKEAVLVSSTIQREAPDIVLLDVNMPAVSGDKLVEIIRGHPAGERTILLLYSGRPADELEPLARRSGADGFIQKGKDPHLLASQLDLWMNRVKHRAEQVLASDAGP